jgi:hypothetical protein
MLRRNINWILPAIILLVAKTAHGADLKQQTLDSWEQYLRAANAHVQERAASGHFLWADESAERLAQLRAGEILVAPIGAHVPQAVPNGLIHHWIGAAFIPGARIEDVVSLVRNYDHYSEYYKPSVLDAKTLSRKGDEDHFTMVVADKSMFMKRALDSEYQSHFVEVDSKKWYSVAETVHVHEVADFAQPGERIIPDGEGSGYIWRLCTISRYEERDGGVYIETEALALSRPIPMTLHWVVDPIVRRISRATLTSSLEQTRDATGAAVKTAALTASRRLSVVRASVR